MRVSLYTREQLDWLRENRPLMNTRELAAAFNSRFHRDISAKSLLQVLSYHQIFTGRKKNSDPIETDGDVTGIVTLPEAAQKLNINERTLRANVRGLKPINDGKHRYKLYDLAQLVEHLRQKDPDNRPWAVPTHNKRDRALCKLFRAVDKAIVAALRAA